MPRAIVGTFKVGTGVRVGQNTLDFLAPARLRLGGKPFSVMAVSDAEAVVLPTRARMHLVSKPFTLTVNQALSFASPKLHFAGDAFIVTVPVGPTYATKPTLRLGGKPFTVGISQVVPFGRPVLRLRARKPARVGVPGLIPSIPELVILTPSPVELEEALTPSAVEVGLLTPTGVRAV